MLWMTPAFADIQDVCHADLISASLPAANGHVPRDANLALFIEGCGTGRLVEDWRVQIADGDTVLFDERLPRSDGFQRAIVVDPPEDLPGGRSLVMRVTDVPNEDGLHWATEIPFEVDDRDAVGASAISADITDATWFGPGTLRLTMRLSSDDPDGATWFRVVAGSGRAEVPDDTGALLFSWETGGTMCVSVVGVDALGDTTAAVAPCVDVPDPPDWNVYPYEDDPAEDSGGCGRGAGSSALLPLVLLARRTRRR